MPYLEEKSSRLLRAAVPAILALSRHVHIWTLVKEIHEGQGKGQSLPQHWSGDWVWVKPSVLNIRTQVEGPYVVVLTTPHCLKAHCIGPGALQPRTATQTNKRQPEKSGR